ncbi:peptidoglycan-binding domain-containing protein [Oerskovia sp. M15]
MVGPVSGPGRGVEGIRDVEGPIEREGLGGSDRRAPRGAARRGCDALGPASTEDRARGVGDGDRVPERTADPDSPPTITPTPEPVPEPPAPAEPAPPAETPRRPPPNLPAPEPETTELVRGSTGDRVVALQQRLADLGYWGATPDGSFGPGTQQAVWALQKAAGIARDGRVGPATLAALDQGCGRHRRARPAG